MSEGLDLDGAGEALGKRVGPLPVAGWLAAVVGGLGIAWYIRRSGQGSDAGTADAGTGYTTAGEAVTGGTGGAAVSDPYGPATDVPDLPDPAPSSTAITTNAQWRIAAVKYLIGLNVAGTSAEKAVAAYFAGTVLTAQQGTWINQVLAGIGPTPAPVPPIHISTGTGSTPATPAPKPPSTQPVPKTNTEWKPHAIYWLRVHGNYGHGMSTAAATTNVETYLAGRALTQNQANNIKAVNAGYRPPPHPLPIKLTHTALTSQAAASGDARRDTGTF